MKLTVYVTDEVAEACITEALKMGFKRNPFKEWTDKERREAVRFYIDRKLPA